MIWMGASGNQLKCHILSGETPRNLRSELRKIMVKLKSGIGQICRNILLVPIWKETGPNFFGLPPIEHASKQPKVYAQPSAKKANQSLRENFFHGPSWSVSSHRIHDPPRTRTWNLRLLRPTPYPLGQRAIILERLCHFVALFQKLPSDQLKFQALTTKSRIARNSCLCSSFPPELILDAFACAFCLLLCIC